jgi:hypothetical protein
METPLEKLWLPSLGVSVRAGNQFHINIYALNIFDKTLAVNERTNEKNAEGINVFPQNAYTVRNGSQKT